jgi:hypothetical protein
MKVTERRSSYVRTEVHVEPICMQRSEVMNDLPRNSE